MSSAPTSTGATRARGLRVLYAGQLWEGGTCLERMRAMQTLGVDVVPVDLSRADARHPRILRMLAWRMAWGPVVKHTNDELLASARKAGKIDVAWIDKGIWITAETLARIKSGTGATLVHYTPDPALVFHRTRQFVKALPLYDLAFTTKPYEVDLYRRAGAQRIELLEQSYSARRFFPRSIDARVRARYAAPVTFIGHHETHYRRLVHALFRAGLPIRVWGPGWSRQARIRRWPRTVVAGGAIYGDDYPIALCAASIGLGFLSKLTPDTTTTRTFEIPACGTLLLAERTDRHRQLFREGVEAEFFSSADELVEKVRFYTDERNRARREAIAAAGRQRCVTSGYTDEKRVSDMLDSVVTLRQSSGNAM